MFFLLLNRLAPNLAAGGRICYQRKSKGRSCPEPLLTGPIRTAGRSYMAMFH